MAPAPDTGDQRPRGSAAVSRRTVLQASALGISAGLFAGVCAAPAHAAAADVPERTASTIPPQAGRRVLVTGGNGHPQDDRSGLGYQDALALARAGADVTIASRNAARGQEAVRAIRAEVPGAAVRFETLDLADQTSVRAFAARMRASGQGLDVLINNAGVMGRARREVSVDGFERVLATNTLGHFTLTALLLPLLKKARDPRIVWVGSLRTSDALPFDDLQLARSYAYTAAYDNSKLANLMLAIELDRRSTARGWGVSSLAAHPGVARTNLIPDGPGLDSAEGWRFRFLPFFFQPAAQGALPTLYAATDPKAVSGGYYGPTGLLGLRGPPGVAIPPAAARDPRAAERLWAALERLTQVTFE